MGAQTAGGVEKYSGVVFIWHARVPMITQSSAWFAKSCLAAQANPGNTPSSQQQAYPRFPTRWAHLEIQQALHVGAVAAFRCWWQRRAVGQRTQRLVRVVAQLRHSSVIECEELGGQGDLRQAAGRGALFKQGCAFGWGRGCS